MVAFEGSRVSSCPLFAPGAPDQLTFTARAALDRALVEARSTPSFRGDPLQAKRDIQLVRGSFNRAEAAAVDVEPTHDGSCQWIDAFDLPLAVGQFDLQR